MTTDLEMLRSLVDAAQEYGRDVPDHRCNPTDNERPFWNAVYAASHYLRDNPTSQAKTDLDERIAERKTLYIARARAGIAHPFRPNPNAGDRDCLCQEDRYAPIHRVPRRATS